MDTTTTATAATTSTTDVMAERRAAMDAKFRAAQAARMAGRNAATEDDDARAAQGDGSASSAAVAYRAGADPTPHEFWRKFQDEAAGLRNAINEAKSLTSAEASTALDAKKRQLDELQATVTAAVRYLPMYDVQQCQATIKELEAAIEAARKAASTRKKFTFSRKTGPSILAGGATSGSNDTSVTSTGAAAAVADHAPAVVAAPSAPAPAITTASSGAAHAESWQRFQETEREFKNETGKLLVLHSGEAKHQDGVFPEFRLTNLTDCTVILLDPLRALHVDNLKRCKIYTGPIAGSALIEACEDCVFMLALRQLRIHTSHRCDWRIHILSRPIIEHCDTMRFGPYPITYPALASQLQLSDLNKPAAATMWNHVDDFGWHKAAQSPNWSVIPTTEALPQLGTDLLEYTPAAIAMYRQQPAAVAAPPAVAAAGTVAAADEDPDEL